MTKFPEIKCVNIFDFDHKRKKKLKTTAQRIDKEVNDQINTEKGKSAIIQISEIAAGELHTRLLLFSV